MKTTILTVMQNPMLQASLNHLLMREGFDVVAAKDPDTVTTQVHRQFARLVVTSLRESQALELCRKIRKCCEIPILVHLPEPSERSEWMCFQAGASDVVSEATSKRVLVARVNELVQRSGGESLLLARTITSGPLVVDLDARTLHVTDVPVELTRTEFDLLAQLMSQPRRVHVRSDLVHAVWGGPYPEHVLETHLSRLRKKIRAVGGPAVGTAVRGIGYRLGIDDRQLA